MVKGGKRYYSVNKGGKWFAHPDLPGNETRNRETCTSTGIMLTQVKSSLPQALDFERYPKWKTQQVSRRSLKTFEILPIKALQRKKWLVSSWFTLQKPRKFPFSDHDNKHAIRDNIAVFAQGAGRRKCLEEYSQQNSHLCLCHDGADCSAEDTRMDLATYRTDFTGQQAVNVPTGTRRFPRSHKKKSEEAALAQAGERFMWFGRSDLSETSQKFWQLPKAQHLPTPNILPHLER